jgi:hypothetical protein
MQVLQYVITYQEVMTHIDVGDDNSTPEQNMVRADRVELSQAFELCGFRRCRCRAELLGPVCGVRTIPSPSPGDPELRWCPSSVYNFPAQALAWSPIFTCEIA